MQNQSRVVIARCFVFLLALSVVIGSSCTLKQRQQTTLRIWQTAVDPKAVAVLKDSDSTRRSLPPWKIS